MKSSLVVYENNRILEKIYEVSDSIRDKLVDQTLFEERSIKRVGEYLLKDEKNIHNKRYINRIIYEVAKSVLERNKKEYSQLFVEFKTENEDGDEVEFDPKDVLADVESEIIAKEMTALLAQGDHRKKVILGSWMDGNDNNSEISRLLAQSVGGNTESHRKYIQRFRNDCYEYCANRFVAV